jgi:aldose 1-epimerase
MTMTGQQFDIAAGEHAATVVEVGGGLRRYTHRGQDVTFSYAEDELPPRGCGAVLVPWPNRLRGGRYHFDGSDYQVPITEVTTGNANHGLGRWARWVPVSHEPSAVTLALDIVPQTGWPFEVHVEVSYVLSADAGLTVTAVALNTGTRRAPFGVGFHPYVAVPEGGLGDVHIQLPATEHIVVDDAKIPVGNRSVAGTKYDLRHPRRLGEFRVDDAFTGLTAPAGRAVAEVRTRGGGARLWFDEAFSYAQVYTPDIVAHGRTGVAVEPMSCPADAFNSGEGLVVLEPGGSWSGSWGIQPLRR